MTEVSINSVVLQEISNLVLAIIDSFTDEVVTQSTRLSEPG